MKSKHKKKRTISKIEKDLSYYKHTTILLLKATKYFFLVKNKQKKQTKPKITILNGPHFRQGEQKTPSKESLGSSDTVRPHGSYDMIWVFWEICISNYSFWGDRGNVHAVIIHTSEW